MAEATTTTNNTNKPATPVAKHMNPIIVGTFAFLITVVISGTILIITFKEPSKTVTQTIVVKDAVAEIGPLVPLGNEIIVNLPSELEGEGEHYLKVNVTLEVDNEKVKEEVGKRVPQIRDLLIQNQREN
jgi:flagellar basal body-associated protein FliL